MQHCHVNVKVAGVIIIRQMLLIVEISINDIKISVILNHTDVFI